MFFISVCNPSIRQCVVDTYVEPLNVYLDHLCLRKWTIPLIAICLCGFWKFTCYLLQYKHRMRIMWFKYVLSCILCSLV